MADPSIGIIMGSTSDWETMRHTAATLDALGVIHESRVVSAHRTPKRLYDYAHSAKERGLKVIIAGAGGAAHLPGMAASMTELPVLGVPIESKSLKGMDSLLSIVQMPAGIPVGTLAIGKAGAINAALLATAMLASTDEALAGRLADWRARQTDAVPEKPEQLGGMRVPPGSTIGILGGGQLGRMMALAAAGIGYKCHIFDPHEQPCAAEVAARFTLAGFDDEEALRRFGGQCDVITYEFENLPVEPLRVLGDRLRPGLKSLAVAQDRGTEKSFLETTGARVAPWRAVISLNDVDAAVAELGLPIVLKTRRYGYDGKGQAW